MTVSAFDPPSSLEEGCAKLLASARDTSNLKPHEFETIELERRIAAFEAEILQSDTMRTEQPPCPPDLLFEDSSIWETVAEAALSGMAMQFSTIAEREGLHAIACTVTTDQQTVQAIAAHANFTQAIRRSIARALDRATKSASAAQK